MQIGQGALQWDDPLLDIIHFLEEILSRGVLKKQNKISQLSTGAEYCAMANTTTELTWQTFLLNDLRITFFISSHTLLWQFKRTSHENKSSIPCPKQTHLTRLSFCAQTRCPKPAGYSTHPIWKSGCWPLHQTTAESYASPFLWQTLSPAPTKFAGRC